MSRLIRQAEERRRNYTIAPPAAPEEGPPIESVLPPVDGDGARPLAPAGPPAVQRAAQEAVGAIDLASCASGELDGRARLLVEANGRVTDVALEDAATLPAQVKACVRLRLRAAKIADSDAPGRRAIATVSWSIAQGSQPGGV